MNVTSKHQLLYDVTVSADFGRKVIGKIDHIIWKKRYVGSVGEELFGFKWRRDKGQAVTQSVGRRGRYDVYVTITT